MTERTAAPDISQFAIPMNAWTEPFWKAAANKELKLPRCGVCGTFRWPPGPFCPECRSQAVEWMSAGPARIYSYTVLRQKPARDGDAVRHIAPTLVEFPEAGGVRLMGALVDAPLDAITIGAVLEVRWVSVGDTHMPQFVLT